MTTTTIFLEGNYLKIEPLEGLCPVFIKKSLKKTTRDLTISSRVPCRRM